MDLIKWAARKFDFNFPAEDFPIIINRLKGTALHIQNMVEGLSKEILTKKVDDAWSIQEHIGHLTDLDELHDGRVNDYLNQLPILRAADMTNQKTNDAHHNEREVLHLINEFREMRDRLIFKLESLNPVQSALHPRLQKQMRVVDMAFFVAEHDDHHLMIIKNLLKKATN